jgi:hypothetical protein
MGSRLLLFFLMSFFVHHETDLSVFLKSIDGKIIYIRSFDAVLVCVKNESISECPGVIVAIFSDSGKRLTLNACSFDEITRYQISPQRKMYTICFLVNHKIYVYKKRSEERRKH